MEESLGYPLSQLAHQMPTGLPPVVREAPTTKRLKILIAEDEPMVAQGLRVQLEELGHSVVGIAYDGRDAVGKAESLEPDIVLLDIKMPRLDGLEATRQIMSRRPLPIVLVTAHSDPDLIQKAMMTGVMGYLLKPVDRKHLVPAIALATTRFVDLMMLRKDVQSLREALIHRQQVERAKGILERRMGLSEDQAHKRIQQLARHDRCTLSEAAGKVIAADRLFAEIEVLA
jgi:AmiR/NasT family two-component response regulator